MRTPIYRHLDRPFKYMGFSVIELILVAVIFVGGTELAALFGFSGYWVVALALLAASFFTYVRLALGELFIVRVIRFMGLPSTLRKRLIFVSKRSTE